MQRSRILGSWYQMADLPYDPKRKIYRPRSRLAEPTTWAAAACGTLLLLILLLRHPAPALAPPAAGAAGVPPAPRPPPGTLTERLQDRAVRITPSYRGPGRTEVFPAFANANRVLVASAGRLLWHHLDSGETRVLHEGQGVYYGVFPGSERDLLAAPTTLWAVSRPVDWRRRGAQERLLHIDMETGEELGSVPLPSRFTHDAVRRRERVYVASTADGGILRLAFPAMEQEAKIGLYSAADHVNTLAPTHDDKLWALLHRKGQSALVQVDLAGRREAKRFTNVGAQAHGLVLWDRFVLTLDSEGGRLLRVDAETGEAEALWADARPGRFLKGLVVLDDVAYFGIGPRLADAAARADPAVSCELAAFDLRAGENGTGRLLWARGLPTRGMVNTVAAPHLAVESTTYSVNLPEQMQYRNSHAYELLRQTWEPEGQEDQGSGEPRPGDTRAPSDASGEPRPGDTHAPSDASGEPRPGDTHAPEIRLRRLAGLAAGGGSGPSAGAGGSRWASGLPRLRLGRAPPEPRGALRLGQVDVAALREAVLALPAASWDEAGQRATNAWLSGRSGLLGSVKPGAQAALLVFSDRDGQQAYRFPWYHRLAPALEPLLQQLLGAADAGGLIRAQLARLPPGAEVLPHVDAGGYAQRAHRLHVVLSTNGGARLRVCGGQGHPVQQRQQWQQQQQESGEEEGVQRCEEVPAPEGAAFELNNLRPHAARNTGAAARVHLILDVAEAAPPVAELAVGQVCEYDQGAGVIDCGGGAAAAVA